MVIDLVAPELMSSHPKNHSLLAKIFSSGILVRSTCSNSIAFCAPFFLDVVFSCLLRYDLKLKVSDWRLNINALLFYYFTQNYTARERGSIQRSPIRLLDLTSNLHFSPLRDIYTQQTNQE